MGSDLHVILRLDQHTNVIGINPIYMLSKYLRSIC